MELFREKNYDLGLCHLVSSRSCDLQNIAGEFANMDPWKRLDFSSNSLAGYFGKTDENLFGFGVILNQNIVGVITVRHPWMRGPYLEFMGLLPSAQNTGIGRQLLSWLESQAKEANQRNIWTAVSEFNGAAYRFYTGFGFKKIASLDNLVSDNFAEILLRKQIFD